jgi:hypothetical protein
MNDEFAEPTSPARRKVIYRKLALLPVVAGVVMLVFWFVLDYMETLGECDRVPWHLGVQIFQILIFVIAATFCARISYQFVRAAQMPLPDALLFRRARIRRGRPVLAIAFAILAMAGLILFIGGVDAGLIIAAYVQSESVECSP